MGRDEAANQIQLSGVEAMGAGKPRRFEPELAGHVFKNADIKIGSAQEEHLKSLWAFQKKLRGLGHFYTNYDNIEHLKLQFRDQLDKMLD